MGLDNFWRLKEGQSHPDFDPPLTLCGGLFSNSGKESFRGKVYSEFFDDVLSINLFQDSISTEELIEGLYRLNIYISQNPNKDWECSYLTREITFQEILDIQKMLNAYIKLEATLESWY